MLTIQYLEPSPELESLPPNQVGLQLQKAFDLLPFTHLLIGWEIPPRLLEACKKIAERYAIKFMRWHPLLTYNQAPLDPSLQVINVLNEPIPGHGGMPEFTFFCPNHALAQERIEANLYPHIHSGIYDGFFLDRIRFPSPSADLYRGFGCFCTYCKKTAQEIDLDLNEIQQKLIKSYQEKLYPSHFLNSFSPKGTNASSSHADLDFQRFMLHRAQTISNTIHQVVTRIKEENLEVGLDAFSPSIAYMVGQDLSQITPLADWTKVMTYGHTLGPAGIPFELSQMAQFLINFSPATEQEILTRLGDTFDIGIPNSFSELVRKGLSPSSLAQEVEKAVRLSPKPILAGIELVEIPHIAELHEEQIESDLSAIKNVKPSGLAISWDLWHIPYKRLEIVSKVWF
jgi:hypothetical protein